jgi:hypothetical protein
VGCTMPREFKSVQGHKVVQILESSVSTSFSVYDLDLGISCSRDLLGIFWGPASTSGNESRVMEVQSSRDLLGAF